MDSFGTSDMAEALPTSGNGPATNGTGPPKNEEAHAAARKAGWVAPTAYDYNAADARGPPPAEDGAVDEIPQWAHNAARYEWNGELGDTGPHVPDLEAMLYRSEFRNRKGIKFDNLCAIKVVAEAAEKPKPIIDVSRHPLLTI